MAGGMGISRVGAFLNKITSDGQVEEIASQLGEMAVFGSYGYDRSVQDADLKRTSVMDCSSELVGALRVAKEAMLSSFFGVETS
jgi:CO dehydrogenase nickel-insertion accessory protein CooC1